jgi:cytochrome c oxidase subunit 2
MFENFHLFPESASVAGGQVDRLYLALVGISAFFTLLIVAAILWCALRYRRSRNGRPEQIQGSIALELTWSLVPLAIALVVFGWGAKLYFDVYTPPPEGLEVYVTGKQWMWKLQHPTGQREINTLHVPAHRPIVLTLTSEDVIHSFYVPAMRFKRDAVPGTYTRVWFEADRPGTYHLFCAEYCGTKHSEMIGQVVVMDPLDYEEWLAAQPAVPTPVEAGRVLFESLRCDTCHAEADGPRGPSLRGLFGSDVRLRDGGTVVADERYVRDAILAPQRHVAAGFEPLMPTYAGQVSEDELLQLVAFVKSLQARPAEAPR